MDIFLSRPTWIKDDYQKGLDNFYTFLNAKNVNPRTIGKSDYPSESPLDEVINLMKKCSGIIVLGYPQIEIKEGNIKENVIDKKIALATEWNHIEASLAYSQKLPLLIIHDTGISRGLFDRGAINNFIYEKDLKNESWVLSEDISGAIENWLAKVKDFDQGEKFYEENPIKNQKSNLTLTKDELQFLELFISHDSTIFRADFEHITKKSSTFIDMVLTKLVDKKLLKKYWQPGFPIDYSLTQNGREYLHEIGKLIN